jgi:dCMP deaminase
MRIDLDLLLMENAELWGKRSTCSRLSVGCILADRTGSLTGQKGAILSHGYNGTLPGRDHCQHTDDRPCEEAVHAEMNAVLWAARRGVSVEGTTAYITHAPCFTCARVLIIAGVGRVFFGQHYRLAEGVQLLRSEGIQTQRVANDTTCG